MQETEKKCAKDTTYPGYLYEGTSGRLRPFPWKYFPKRNEGTDENVHRVSRGHLHIVAGRDKIPRLSASLHNAENTQKLNLLFFHLGFTR